MAGGRPVDRYKKAKIGCFWHSLANAQDGTGLERRSSGVNDMRHIDGPKLSSAKHQPLFN